MLRSSASATGPATWQLRLLGEPVLVEPATQSVLPLRPKDAALLAVLAVGGPIDASHLACWLWPDASACQADTSLRWRWVAAAPWCAALSQRR